MADTAPASGAFLIQVGPAGGARLEAESDDVIKGSQVQLDAAAGLAERAAQSMRSVFTAVAPSKGTVELALSFEGSTGLPILARGKVGATITVTLEWDGDRTADSST